MNRRNCSRILVVCLLALPGHSLLAATADSAEECTNSELRDRIGCEFLTYWLRSDRLSDTTRRALLQDLSNPVAMLPGDELTDAASYRFNEGDRLARVVSSIISRGLVGTETIVQWLSLFETPQSMPAWNDAYKNQQRMLELHNNKQFLRALSGQLVDSQIDPAINERLTSLLRTFSQLV